MAKHTPADKVRALAMAEVAGTSTASQTLGIPLRTVQKWRQDGASDPEVARLVGQATDRAKEDLVVEASEMLVDLAALIHSNVRRMTQDSDNLTPSQLRDLSITGGVWHDKLASLQGRNSPAPRYGQSVAPANLEDQGPSNIVRRILAEMVETRALPAPRDNQE